MKSYWVRTSESDDILKFHVMNKSAFICACTTKHQAVLLATLLEKQLDQLNIFNREAESERILTALMSC